MKNKTSCKIFVTSLVIVGFIINCSKFYDKQISDETILKINQYLTVLASTDQFSGSVLVTCSGNILISKGYNFADREHNIQNTPKTKFRIGSLTKQFTAMAIMILQEKGILNTHDLICDYISDCPKSWQDITIHHLLTHSSGIPGFEYFPDNLYYERLPTTVEKTIERFKNKKLLFAPGTEFNYSSSGYVLLGYIIEQVSGKSYENMLSEYIFEPLVMKNTGYDHPREVITNRARGYSLEDSVITNAIHFEMDTPYSAGGLYSTVEDLFLWDQALHTTRLVTRETLDTILSIQIPIADYGYGYGWRIRKLYDHTLVDHNGVISGFRSNIYRFIEDQVCIISLSNFEFSNLSKINRDLSAYIFNNKLD